MKKIFKSKIIWILIIIILLNLPPVKSYFLVRFDSRCYEVIEYLEKRFPDETFKIVGRSTGRFNSDIYCTYFEIIPNNDIFNKFKVRYIPNAADLMPAISTDYNGKSTTSKDDEIRPFKLQ